MANRIRTNQIGFFLSDDEKKILDEKFKLSGVKSKSAYTEIHAIKATVNKAIDYICNPEKTAQIRHTI